MTAVRLLLRSTSPGRVERRLRAEGVCVIVRDLMLSRAVPKCRFALPRAGLADVRLESGVVRRGKDEREVGFRDVVASGAEVADVIARSLLRVRLSPSAVRPVRSRVGLVTVA